jgi:hypothetical protein
MLIKGKRTEVREMFRAAFNGNANLMTPRAVAFGIRGGRAWELSTGEGFRGASLYGVTVLDLDGKPDHGASRSFLSEADARAYIKAGFPAEVPAPTL